MADDTKHELDEYKQSLDDVCRQLKIIRDQANPMSATTNGSAAVLIVAAEGLLSRLGMINPTTITLDEIVRLSDDVRGVLQSARMFLQRRHPSIVV